MVTGISQLQTNARQMAMMTDVFISLHRRMEAANVTTDVLQFMIVRSTGEL